MKTLSIQQPHTKEEIDAFRKAYNEELYRLVFEDTKDEARARKYVEEHSLGDDERCAMSMVKGSDPLCLAELEYTFN